MTTVTVRVLEFILSFAHPSFGMVTGIIDALLMDPFHVISTIFGAKPYTPTINDQHSVYFLDEVLLNGAYHSILARGNNKSSPILIIVHGGPGATDIPFYKSYSELEKYFVLVHFDQRSACKSYYLNRNIKHFGESITFEQHISDTIALSEWIRNDTRLFIGNSNKRKLFLLGGSWGTMLGMMVIHRRPDLFQKALFRGMCTNSSYSEKSGMKFVLDRMTMFKVPPNVISKVSDLG